MRRRASRSCCILAVLHESTRLSAGASTHRERSRALVEIWDAACAALPHKLGGRELTAQDIIPKAAAVDGKPTDTMPAKPVRKRAENNK